MVYHRLFNDTLPILRIVKSGMRNVNEASSLSPNRIYNNISHRTHAKDTSKTSG